MKSSKPPHRVERTQKSHDGAATAATQMTGVSQNQARTPTTPTTQSPMNATQAITPANLRSLEPILPTKSPAISPGQSPAPSPAQSPAVSVRKVSMRKKMSATQKTVTMPRKKPSMGVSRTQDSAETVESSSQNPPAQLPHKAVNETQQASTDIPSRQSTDPKKSEESTPKDPDTPTTHSVKTPHFDDIPWNKQAWETEELSPARRHLRTCMFIVTYALVLLGLTFVAAVAIMFCEADSNRHGATIASCSDGTKKELAEKWPTTELSLRDATSLADQCVASSAQCYAKSLPKSEIRDIWTSLIFTWELFTTVGYGDVYPMTLAGKICTLIVAFLLGPFYLAIKAEFGQWLTLLMFKITHDVKKFIHKRIFKRDSATYREPSARTRFFIIFILANAHILITSGLSMLIERHGHFASLFDAYYFNVITVMLIGLGDFAPNQHDFKYKIAFLSYLPPLLLIGDTYMAHLNFFMQDRIRWFMKLFIERICCCIRISENKVDPDADKYNEDAGKIFPTIGRSAIEIRPEDCTQQNDKQKRQITEKQRIAKLNDELESLFRNADAMGIKSKAEFVCAVCLRKAEANARQDTSVRTARVSAVTPLDTARERYRIFEEQEQPLLKTQEASERLPTVHSYSSRTQQDDVEDIRKTTRVDKRKRTDVTVASYERLEKDPDPDLLRKFGVRRGKRTAIKSPAPQATPTTPESSMTPATTPVATPRRHITPDSGKKGKGPPTPTDKKGRQTAKEAIDEEKTAPGGHFGDGGT